MSPHKLFYQQLVFESKQSTWSWALVSLSSCIFTLWPTARSFEQRTASHGYLLSINLLTNLLANTWSKPEGRKKRQRENKKKKPSTDKAQNTFNGPLESKVSAKLQFSFWRAGCCLWSRDFLQQQLLLLLIILLLKPPFPLFSCLLDRTH